MPELVGYARVSTRDQSLRLQIDALKAAGVHPDRLHVEKRSAVGKRPELEYAIMDLRPGDTFVVWRLDRLARSMRQLYILLDRIYGAGAQLRSLQESFDFGTVSGKLVLAVLGAVAEFERQIIAQRTAAGIATVRKQGSGKWGRDLIMTEEKIVKAGVMLNEKRMSGPEVAERLGVSTASIYAHWKHVGLHKFRRKRKPKGKR